MTKEHTSAAHSTGSEDLKKKPGVASGAGPIRAGSNAAAAFVSGSTGSLARALGVLSKGLEQENISRVGFTSAWVTGVLEAYAVFFDQMAETSRRVLEETRNAPDTDIAGAEGIDYERLARLVANELRKQKIDDPTA